jgi:prophage regulatory protein
MTTPVNAQSRVEKAAGAQLLRLSHVLKKLNVGRSTIYSWIDKNSKYFQPSFPKPIRLGLGRSVFWLEAEIEAWLSSQLPKTRPSNFQGFTK